MSLTSKSMDSDENERAPLTDKALSKLAHDLSGPCITARGFSGELESAREQVLELLKRLPSDTDPAVMQELIFQLDDEMKHCLFRINDSLSQLDKITAYLKSI